MSRCWSSCRVTGRANLGIRNLLFFLRRLLTFKRRGVGETAIGHSDQLLPATPLVVRGAVSAQRAVVFCPAECGVTLTVHDLVRRSGGLHDLDLGGVWRWRTRFATRWLGRSASGSTRGFFVRGFGRHGAQPLEWSRSPSGQVRGCFRPCGQHVAVAWS